jgi:hypothetical protein
MRIAAGFLLLLTGVLAPQLTSPELRDRYGRPDRERFLVRPGISLTVEYGSDGLACQMIIEAPRPLISEAEFEQDSLLSMDDVTQIMDEVIPVATRGAGPRPLVDFQSSSNVASFEGYENLTISHVTHDCASLKPKCEARAIVTFKRKTCENLAK